MLFKGTTIDSFYHIPSEVNILIIYDMSLFLKTIYFIQQPQKWPAVIHHYVQALNKNLNLNLNSSTSSDDTLCWFFIGVRQGMVSNICVIVYNNWSWLFRLRTQSSSINFLSTSWWKCIYMWIHFLYTHIQYVLFMDIVYIEGHCVPQSGASFYILLPLLLWNSH